MTRKVNYDCYDQYAKNNLHLWIRKLHMYNGKEIEIDYSYKTYEEMSKTLDYKFFELKYNIQNLWEEIKKSLKLKK